MIDKNTPLKFVSDKDERLLKSGEMTDAQNITITERGVGSGSIVKTFKGFSQITPDTGEPDLETDVKVIGQVEDPQRDFVYFFVATTGSGNENDMIVQYSGSTGKYKTVLKSSWLNFDESSFVKADLINKAFQQDGVLQTVIYFTDNDNPPRKINVDRALAGDYEEGDKDFSLLTMRAAPRYPVSFRFDEDTNFSGNNFQKEVFQFATQYLYTDGEESALSPFSKLATSPAISIQNVVGLTTTVTDGNVCKIDIGWGEEEADNYKDVDKIRLLCRVGNSNPFYIIEDFDPNEDLTTTLFDSEDTLIYDSATGEYSFYNERNLVAISDLTSNKNYDNVPKKASGQTISGNRLMFSDYEEGYPNKKIEPSLSVSYSNDVDLGGTFHLVAPNAAAAAITYPADAGQIGNGDVFIDLTSGGFAWPSPNNATSLVPAGTVTRLSFDYDPYVSVYKDTQGIFTISCTVDDGEFDLTFGASSGQKIELKKAIDDASRATVGFEYISQNSQSVANLANGIADYLDDADLKASKICNVDALTGVVSNSTSTTYTDGGNVNLGQVTVRATYTFDDTSDDGANDGDFRVKPYISKIEITNSSYSSNGFEFTTQTTTSMDEQSDAVYEVTTGPDATVTYLYNQSNYSVAPQNVTTFKHGSSHDFGIVYYDKWGRQGFVNKIGSVYVKHPAERTSGYGAARVRIDWGNNLPTTQPPLWAHSWQVVYGGSQFSNLFSYTTGGAYYAKDSSGNTIEEDKRIFVSLKNLSKYREETGALKDYSFTEGDICRVLSYSNGGTKTYPSANDGSIIEFQVVGVVTFDSNDNPIKGSDTSNLDQYYGDFLVLRAPRVEGGAQVDGDNDGTLNDDLKYNGFDWFSITNEDYPTDSNPNLTAVNYWGQESVIEILTPKKSSEATFYYEIGEGHSAKHTASGKTFNTPHGPIVTLTDGDVRYRTTSCNGPVLSGSWNKGVPEEWDYTSIPLESETPSDLISSKSWSRGRAHVVFDKAATVNRYNSITYSEAYADDTAVLTLSSFVPSLANFFDLPSENGACTYIGKLNDKLIGIQENKASLIGVNKGVIETGSQSGLISLSAQVLQNILPFGGDYGTQNPESVLFKSGVVYFADKARQAIIRLSERSYDIISDIDIKSFVDSEFSSWDSGGSNKLFSGYDPDDDIYYLTFAPGGSYTGMTLGFDEKGDFWQGKYTFYPDMYSRLKDKMIICKYISIDGITDGLLHKTDGENSNKFPGEASRAESKVTVISNAMPSVVKSYESISVEADSAWDVDLETSSGQTTASLDFSEKEDAFYALVTGDTSSNSQRHYLPVGTVDSVNADVITMKTSLRGIHIPYGYELAVNDGSNDYTETSYTVSAVDRENNTITASGDFGSGIAAGDRLYVLSNKSVNGDQIRGHYCKINCSITPSTTNREELYAINAKFSESRANHGLAQ